LNYKTVTLKIAIMTAVHDDTQEKKELEELRARDKYTDRTIEGLQDKMVQLERSVNYEREESEMWKKKYEKLKGIMRGAMDEDE
jgi:predicted  nucleic acid-binding Zn-ribbon protein